MESEQFIRLFMPVAVKVEQETGIPALAMMTQAALETGWGTSVKNNNYFGIKSGTFGKKQLVRTKEVLKHKNGKFPRIYSITKRTDGRYLYDIDDWFFSYDSPIDSFRGYAEFIKANKRYSKALCNLAPESFLREVAAAGYATDPGYNAKLQSILNSIKRRL